MNRCIGGGKGKKRKEGRKKRGRERCIIEKGSERGREGSKERKHKGNTVFLGTTLL